MTTLHATPATIRLLIVVLAASFVGACTGDGAPDTLPFADDPVSKPAETSVVTTSTEISTSTTLVEIEPSDSAGQGADQGASHGSTTTEVPQAAPLEPTLVVECATNPRTVALTFGEEPGFPLDWEFSVRRQPGGTGLNTVVEQLASGDKVPDEPIVHEVVTNDSRFAVSVANASQTVEVKVDVDRYSGCPVAGSFQGRLVEQIDCVSGAFRFAPAIDSGIVVESIVVDRVPGDDSTLPISPSGVYWVPAWSGPEAVKAIVTFTDASGRYAEHINHWCFGGPFGPDLGGDYKVCSDEEVLLAYPREWFSAIELGGSEGSSCANFGYGPDRGGADPNITLESLGATTLAEATDSLLPPGPWIVAAEEAVNGNGFSDHIGTTAGGDRIRFELAWENAPSLIRRVVWLVDVDGVIWRLEANIQGLEEIDGMANSLQFVQR